MDTTEFLSAILPPEGVYLIAASTDKGFRHRGFESIEEAADFAIKCDKRGVATYHACATYKRAPYIDENGKLISRTSVNWHSAKSFWADIDCGSDKADSGHGYATQREGAKAILSWCIKREFPIPMLVSSGRGIHAYWCLTEQLQPVDWVKSASTLKQVMQKDGLLIDPSRASDFASVLRPVGTHNRKDPNNPLEVKVVKAQDVTIDTTELVEKIASLGLEVCGELPPPPPWLTGEEVEEVPYTPIECSAELCANKCTQVALMRDTKGDVGYDHWRGVIGIIKHCKEGIDLARDWTSRRHETGHQNLDVDTRFNTWTSGPTTCEFFQKCNAGGCDGCQFLGKIKTPLVLGRIEPEPEAETVDAVVEDGGKQTQVKLEVPELPENYQWDGTNLVRYIQSKDGVLEARPFCKTRFYLINRIRNEEGKFEFVARAHMPKGMIRDFNIPGSVIGAGGSRLMELLGAYEIMTMNSKDSPNHMTAYLKDAVNKLTQKSSVTSTHTSFGWQNDGSFLLGTRLYRPDGTEVEALLSGYAADSVGAFPRPKGSLETYAEKLNWIYNREGMEPMQYLICSMLAAPLVGLAEPTYNGIPCALTGADSGKGKTTAAICALYAYGRAFPDLVISGKAGATARAQAALLGTLGNLPVLFDEITNIDQKALSDLCYALSNGVERIRLRASRGGVAFSNRESWRTQVAMTGNSHLGARLALGGNTEAEAMRVFEIRVDQYNIPKLDPLAVSTAVSEIEKNSGVAGEVFVKYLVQNRNTAVNILLDTYGLFTGEEDLMTEPKYRFFRNHMAVTLAGARILKDLGVVKFDIEKLRDFAVEAVRALLKETKDLNTVEPEDILSQMLTDLSPRIATTLTFEVGSNEPLYQFTSNQGLVGRAIRGNDLKRDEHDGKMWVSIKAVREWCVEHRVDMSTLTRKALSLGVITQRSVRVYLGKSMTVVTPQTRCWEFDLKKLETLGDNDVEDDSNNN